MRYRAIQKLITAVQLATPDRSRCSSKYELESGAFTSVGLSLFLLLSCDPVFANQNTISNAGNRPAFNPQTALIARNLADTAANPQTALIARSVNDSALEAQTRLIAQRNRPPSDLAQEAMDHQNWNRAVRLFTEALGLNHTNTDAYMKRGQCYVKLANYDEAISDFSHAIELSPSDFNAYLWRGTTRAKAGSHAQAIEDYLKAVKLHPELAEQYKKGMGSGGEETVERTANKANIGAVHDYEEAMRIYNSEGQPDIAPRDKQNDGHHKKEKNEIILSESSESSSILSKPELEIANVNKAIELDSNNPELYYKRGSLNAKMNRYDKALKDFYKAIFLDPMQARYYLSRARLYHDHNEPDLCKADIQHAQSVDARLPSHIEFK